MEEENNITIQDNNPVNESKLIYEIWIKPTQTLKYILNTCPEKYVTLFIVLGGITEAINKASNKNNGDNMSTMAVLSFAIIGGALFGWISYYLYAFFLSITGKWLNGRAEPQQFRTVLAWASVPTISSLLLLIPELLIFGDDLFRSELSNSELSYTLLYGIFSLIEMVLGIWTIIITVKGISIIQEFGIGKSILNLFLPALLLIGVVVVFALIVYALN
jgi:hypothetical protein